ncbi:MAG: hypothetical protein Q8922_10385 [Bacteroidota bacterium]|nr:hypothetical protein [Bacteroidota bacterium]MDP4234591.1 hypothetical protein [Bacteroidota bacterium]MDP4288332.1 hypothetical protein [Bacteroidota bacterium]
MKRKFYIIGHNPNTSYEAYECLAQGANAIEPDVHYDAPSATFYVSHSSGDPEDYPLLKQYLNDLGDLIRDGSIPNLALAAFDLKPPYAYDIKDLYKLIRNEFAYEFSDIPILTTIGEPSAMAFLDGVRGDQRPNEAVGVDEGVAPTRVYEHFRTLGINYTYGAGLTNLLWRGFYDAYADWVREAIRFRGIAGGLKMTYAWVIDNESYMRDYLDMGADGIITEDIPLISQLIGSTYADGYELAARGDNPFADNMPAISSAEQP